MSKFIPIEQIISLEIDVSEKIDNKNLKNFVFTSLKLNNKNFANDDLMYIHYIDELNQYQIIAFSNKYKFAYFQVFELFYEKKITGLDLYLCDDFFCLYKDGLFYYYQTIEFSLTIEEFLEFINRKFNTKINNYIKIEKDYLEELQNKYLSKKFKTTLKNINIKNDYSFKIYLLYVFILLSISIYLYLQAQQQSLNKDIVNTYDLKLKLEKFKKEHTFLGFANDFEKILENVKLYNLELEVFEYKQSKIKIVLSSKIKDNLYLFLEKYKNDLISSSVHFNENKKNHEVIAYVNLLK